MSDTNSAKLIKPVSACDGAAHRREKYFRQEIAAIDRRSGAAVVTLRIYGSATNSANYACVWVHGARSKKHPEGIHASGSARATGYGYHRPSQAAQEAIEASGFTLAQPIDGRGDGAMIGAVRAVAVACGLRASAIIIHQAHA